MLRITFYLTYALFRKIGSIITFSVIFLLVSRIISKFASETFIGGHHFPDDWFAGGSN
jgi:hypothetical protein